MITNTVELAGRVRDSRSGLVLSDLALPISAHIFTGLGQLLLPVRHFHPSLRPGASRYSDKSNESRHP